MDRGFVDEVAFRPERIIHGFSKIVTPYKKLGAFMGNRWRILVVIFVVLLVAGFWGCHGKRVNLRELTPEEQFAYAKQIFDKKDYHEAKTQFTIIVLNNPGGRIIDKAQFYLAETYYNLKEHILAVAEYEKLIRSLPQSPYVDDASYKVGMCYYRLAPGYGLDQEYTHKAISRFQQFLEDYPDSELKTEAEARLAECRNKLARKEFKTGELYRKMGYYRSAIISFDAVIENYYDTEFADDALYWKGECHRRVGEWEASEEAFQNLLAKYAQSPWIVKAEDKLRAVRETLTNHSKDESRGSNQ